MHLLDESNYPSYLPKPVENHFSLSLLKDIVISYCYPIFHYITGASSSIAHEFIHNCLPLHGICDYCLHPLSPSSISPASSSPPPSLPYSPHTCPSSSPGQILPPSLPPPNVRRAADNSIHLSDVRKQSNIKIQLIQPLSRWYISMKSVQILCYVMS